MSLRFHEIAESYHKILNPFLEDQLVLVGEICRLKSGMRLLDLACGKGEMLARWSLEHGVYGIGVDISQVFLDAAHARVLDIGVEQRIIFIKEEAGKYLKETTETNFDIVSCIGATWIGDGLLGSCELMKPLVKPDGLLLIGEPFWHEPPPAAAYEAMGIKEDEFKSLAGTLDRFESAGLELVEMVLANHDGWDRYEAPQWQAVDDYLRANRSDPEAEELYAWMDKNRRAYLRYGRRYFGWGVFVLRLSNPQK